MRQRKIRCTSRCGLEYSYYGRNSHSAKRLLWPFPNTHVENRIISNTVVWITIVSPKSKSSLPVSVKNRVSAYDSRFRQTAFFTCVRHGPWVRVRLPVKMICRAPKARGSYYNVSWNFIFENLRPIRRQSALTIDDAADNAMTTL